MTAEFASLAHIGYRVVTNVASDTFDLHEAAEQCMRILASNGIEAQWFHVTRQYGEEEMTALAWPPHPKAPKKARRSRRKLTVPA